MSGLQKPTDFENPKLPLILSHQPYPPGCELNQGLRRSSSPSKKLFEMECLSWHMDLAGHPSFHNLKPIEGICWILSHFAKGLLVFPKVTWAGCPTFLSFRNWHVRGREQIGVHTCDRRSSRTDYVEHFPKVDVSHVKHDEERGVLYANGVQPWVVGMKGMHLQERNTP